MNNTKKNGFNLGESYILQTTNNATQTNFMAKQFNKKKNPSKHNNKYLQQFH